MKIIKVILKYADLQKLDLKILALDGWHIFLLSYSFSAFKVYFIRITLLQFFGITNILNYKQFDKSYSYT